MLVSMGNCKYSVMTSDTLYRVKRQPTMKMIAQRNLRRGCFCARCTLFAPEMPVLRKKLEKVAKRASSRKKPMSTIRTYA